jgi:molybdopterin converting factor small subunit
MMRIELEIGFSFKRDLDPGYRDLQVPEDADVETALREFVRRHPLARDRLFDERGQLRGHINALVNGGNVAQRQGLKTTLRNGDRLTILPPIGGG